MMKKKKKIIHCFDTLHINKTIAKVEKTEKKVKFFSFRIFKNWEQKNAMKKNINLNFNFFLPNTTNKHIHQTSRKSILHIILFFGLFFSFFLEQTIINFI